MSITGKVDAMMGGLRRENNALRKNYERERTRTTVLESRILHAFLAAVHAELPCPFCGAETNYVSPFARHIGDCIVETIELAVASPPSVSDATLPVASQHTQQSGAMLDARPSEATVPLADYQEMQRNFVEADATARKLRAEIDARAETALPKVVQDVLTAAELLAEEIWSDNRTDEEQEALCRAVQALRMAEESALTGSGGGA